MADKLHWPNGVGFIHYETLESTNKEAIKRLNSGEVAPFWIFTDHQTNGRGRRARNWVASKGDLAATLVIQLEGAQSFAAQYSFVASLALYQALYPFVSDTDLSLKWPNDVLYRKQKLAGILLEQHHWNQNAYLLIGIGVNLVSKDDHIADMEPSALPPIALKNRIKAEALLSHLATEFDHLDQLYKISGFAEIKKRWLAHATGVGDVITARLMNESITGVFKALDETGALILHTDQGDRIIHAGDIYFGRES